MCALAYLQAGLCAEGRSADTVLEGQGAQRGQTAVAHLRVNALHIKASGGMAVLTLASSHMANWTSSGAGSHLASRVCRGHAGDWALPKHFRALRNGLRRHKAPALTWELQCAHGHISTRAISARKVPAWKSA